MDNTNRISMVFLFFHIFIMKFITQFFESLSFFFNIAFKEFRTGCVGGNNSSLFILPWLSLND